MSTKHSIDDNSSKKSAIESEAREQMESAKINTVKFTLLDGTLMEVKYSLPIKRKQHQEEQNENKPLLVFLHGSFHSAWCWTNNFFSYFTSHGYPCVALSLRGTNGTFAGEGVNKVKVDAHVEDVLHFLERVSCIDSNDNGERDGSSISDFMSEIHGNYASKIPPVLIAHSFGGLTAMKLLEHPKLKEHVRQSLRLQEKVGVSTQTVKTSNISVTRLLSTMALLCSVPPSGIKKMSFRSLRKNPKQGWRIMKGLAMKKAVTDPKLCRLLFFDQENIPCDAVNDPVTKNEGIASEETLQEYMAHFSKDSKVTMDLSDMAKKLPIYATDDDGKSIHLKQNVLQFPALVLGGTDDYIVDRDAVEETARFFGVEDGANTVLVDNAVHDVMLGSCWNTVAEKVEVWLDEIASIALISKPPSNLAQ